MCGQKNKRKNKNMICFSICSYIFLEGPTLHTGTQEIVLPNSLNFCSSFSSLPQLPFPALSIRKGFAVHGSQDHPRFGGFPRRTRRIHKCCFTHPDSLLQQKVEVLVAQSCPTLCDPMDYNPDRLLCPWNSPGKNTGVGCHFLLQGMFLTQGLSPHLLHLLD